MYTFIVMLIFLFFFFFSYRYTSVFWRIISIFWRIISIFFSFYMNSGTLTKYLFLCKASDFLKVPTILLYEKNAENFFAFSNFFFFLSFELNLLDIRHSFFHFLCGYHSYQRNIENIMISKIHINISTPLTHQLELCFL